MEINQGRQTDLIEVLYLLKTCILEMNTKGLKHWNNTVPGPEAIQTDLIEGRIYLMKDKGVCKGMVTLNDEIPDDYKSLDFNQNKTKALYLRNMAVHPRWQGTGIATQLMDFVMNFAREKGFDCIRLDVFEASEQARKIYEKNLFNEVTSFYTSYQKIPFICYEKKL
jgi:ribosomal protein S18 acetylase RimI-like enzyme